jgi:chromosome segregation ATPase
MEGSFLCYIFGEDCRYSYPEKYSQGVIAIPQVMAENARLSSLEQENRSHIQEQSEEIGRLTMELAESGEQQSVLNIRLEELKNKAVEQEKQIEEQEKQKEELKNKVVEQENQIEEVQLLVIGLQADAGEAKKQIEQLETKEKELTKQKDETEQLLEKERLQMAELREELAVCESRNDAILNSKSWKITKPLRTIGGLLKK